MVELENEWIRFAAINAGIRLEVLDQKAHALLGSRPLPLGFGLDVPLSVGGVVLLP
jgi:hypothetical protein